MTYTVPPKKPDPKPRYVRVPDPDEIAAIERADLKSPIGGRGPDGAMYAEWHSLQQYRGLPVEFEV